MSNQTHRIHRHNYEDRYTIYSNSLWEDEYLSWSAKALLAYLLSRPKNWALYRAQLASVYKGEKKGNGKKAIDSCFEELISQGYIVYTAKDEETGKFIHRYDVYPEPFEDFQKKIPKRLKGKMALKQNGLKGGQTSNDSSQRNEKKTTTSNARCSEQTDVDVDKRGGGDPPPDPAPVVVSSKPRPKKKAAVRIKPDKLCVEKPAIEKKPAKTHAALDKLEIPHYLKKLLSEKYAEELIEQGVKCCLAWTKRKSDAAAITVILERLEEGTWQLPKDCFVEKNLEHLKSVAHLNLKMLGDVKILVGERYIEFWTGAHCKRFDDLEDEFLWKQICDHVQLSRSRMAMRQISPIQNKGWLSFSEEGQEDG